MASTSPTDVNFPYPRPHPHPTRNPHSIIIVVVISFGCFFFLAAIMLGIWWLIKKRKERKLICERKDIDVDEHLKVQEMIIPGPCGPKKVLLSVEDDVRVHEDIHKSEIDIVGKAGYGESKKGVAKGLEKAVESSGSSKASGSSQHLTHSEHQV
ncbi:protein TRACHEARY ELEMENT DIFFERENTIATION-RELATED 6-like [Amaranthus tricolor]|uniref:protein TRACHEARY ELEMENT DIFFERENTIATION-RELATED 6-like n=1 Tax=Amaranthus tricolor TaxID=29722 RepID=UPI00258F0F52|nr:protein TRACHEARY ELEMENT DIFFERENTIATION-RELATED 6-like [Amaranthus tricolor]